MERGDEADCNKHRYGLVTEQKKGAYKYFVDLGDRMEVAQSKTAYVDEVGLSSPACCQRMFRLLVRHGKPRSTAIICFSEWNSVRPPPLLRVTARRHQTMERRAPFGVVIVFVLISFPRKHEPDENK
jgi:hypothetical protein